MRKKIIVFFGLILLGLTAYWAFTQYQASKGNQNAGGPSRPLGALRLVPQQVPIHIELPGRLSSSEEAEIRPQINGILIDRLFAEGSFVKAGQQLYQIDPAPYQAAFESAKAALLKAEANFKSIEARAKRYDVLVKLDAVSKQEYDDIQSNLGQANADIEIAKANQTQAKINLDYTKVYAPISGKISKSNVTKGALVTSGQTQALTTITALDPIYIDMTQASGDLMHMLQRVKDLKTIPVTLLLEENQKEYPHQGRVQFHDVTVNQSTGSVSLRAIIPNPSDQLYPGLFVRARLTTIQPDALLVPQNATVRQPDSSLTVWKLNADGAIKSTAIKTSGTHGSNWIVLEGLKKDDVIITEGLITLAEGAKVTPVFAKTNPNGKEN